MRAEHAAEETAEHSGYVGVTEDDHELEEELGRWVPLRILA